MKIEHIIWLVFLGLWFGLAALIYTKPTDATPLHAKIIYIYDGDTVKVMRKGKKEIVRIANIDTAELNTCKKRVLSCECYMAKRARVAMHDLAVRTDGEIIVVPIKEGYYGRTIAEVVLTDGTDVGTYMLMHNLAVPYEMRETANWCEQKRLYEAN